MDKHFQHAIVLLEQQRYEQAEQKLRQALAADPGHGLAHALLAECLCERERLSEATDEAYHAVRLDPGLAAAHAVLARVLHERNYLDEAEAAIAEALRLEPDNANHFARVAGIKMSQRDWPAALAAAEQGLEHDSEHVNCNNYRAMALVQLGRRGEAGQTLEAALARDPEDAFTHANRGWSLLHERKYKEAMGHFREALRLEPGLDYARAGIVEAMKARTGIYALMLRYFLWMNRLSQKAQWAVILGALIGNRLLGVLAKEKPELSPWILPIQIAYVVFALMTWLAMPLFNLLLRLNRFGRYSLSRDQTIASNWVGGLLLCALVCLGIWLGTDSSLALIGAASFGMILLPVCGVFSCPSGWPRVAMACYAGAVAVLGIAAVPLFLLNQELGTLAIMGFIWGSFLSGIVANILMMQTPRRSE